MVSYPTRPLGRGFLAGRFRSLEDLAPDDWRRDSPRFLDDNFARNLAVAEQIRAIALEKGCTAAQLALAWLLAQGAHVVPIPGTTSVGRLEENLAAAAVSLDPQDLARIEAVAPHNTVVERYNPQVMRLLNG